MARMCGFSHHGRWFAASLLGGFFALVLTAAPATAELSSVDAYGGQAQVLGKPVHRHVQGGGSSAQGSGQAGGQGNKTSGSQTTSSGSAQGSSGSGSNASTGSSSTTSTASSSSGGAYGTNGGNSTAGAGGGSHGGGGGGASSTSVNGSSSGSASGQSPPIALANSAAVSDGSLSLSTLDVLALLAVIAGLIAVGVLVRRFSRPSE